MNHLAHPSLPLSSPRRAALAATALAAALLGACGGGSDEPLRIEGQPYPLAVKEREPAMFAVTGVTGGSPEPLRYQWRRNGIDIPGADKDHLVLAGTTLADDGAQYTVAVSRGVLRTVSKAGHLAVVAAGADYPWP